MEVDDLAAFRIALHPVERVQEQRLLITFGALILQGLGYIPGERATVVYGYAA